MGRRPLQTTDYMVNSKNRIRVYNTRILFLHHHRYAVLGTFRCSCLPGTSFDMQLPSDNTASLTLGHGSRPWIWSWQPARSLRRRPRAETRLSRTSTGTWLPLSSIADRNRKWASVDAKTSEICIDSRSLQTKEVSQNHLSNDDDARFTTCAKYAEAPSSK